MEETIETWLILFLLLYCIYLYGIWIKTDSLWEISSGITLLQEEKINNRITDKEFDKIMDRVFSIRKEILEHSWLYLFINNSFISISSENTPLRKLYKLTEDIIIILSKEKK